MIILVDLPQINKGSLDVAQLCQCGQFEGLSITHLTLGWANHDDFGLRRDNHIISTMLDIGLFVPFEVHLP